eukprot:sb/3475607/
MEQFYIEVSILVTVIVKLIPVHLTKSCLHGKVVHVVNFKFPEGVIFYLFLGFRFHWVSGVLVRTRSRSRGYQTRARFCTPPKSLLESPHHHHHHHTILIIPLCSLTARRALKYMLKHTKASLATF